MIGIEDVAQEVEVEWQQQEDVLSICVLYSIECNTQLELLLKLPKVIQHQQLKQHQGFLLLLWQQLQEQGQPQQELVRLLHKQVMQMLTDKPLQEPLQQQLALTHRLRHQHVLQELLRELPLQVHQ